jgi:hypothetical protein
MGCWWIGSAVLPKGSFSAPALPHRSDQAGHSYLIALLYHDYELDSLTTVAHEAGLRGTTLQCIA